MESDKDSSSRTFTCLHGFGYVESMDDYKFRAVHWEYGIPLNGAIHWVADYYDGEHSFPQIVAFDLVEEKFKTFPLLDQVFRKLKRFTVLRDHLCIINQREDKFWIMEEYGAKESWTRISIPNGCSWKVSGYLSMKEDKCIPFSGELGKRKKAGPANNMDMRYVLASQLRARRYRGKIGTKDGKMRYEAKMGALNFDGYGEYRRVPDDLSYGYGVDIDGVTFDLQV
ncbi:hypothetical protein EZV62_011922 [Acer yangbiense]|uniref:F-box associated beta-propeller type 1 domain-containing protein n=1 Tax=Acer yangbiense TaxID=1000413 RepID=A0A5C7I7A6_9ROSI|nr:hypothetical protein EZV62_011922 [Acer yangbiense]